MTRRVLGILALLALAGGGVLWALRLRPRSDELVLSGTIESRDVQVGSLVGGRIKAVKVEEGASVSPGQEIVLFETDLLDLQIREQQGRVAEMRANLEKAERGPRMEETARAKAEADNAERDRARLQRLHDEGIVGTQDYDAAVTRARTSLENYQELQRGSRSEDIAAARAALERESGHLAYLERQREETVVHAPAAGIVQTIDLRPGDLVGANQPVATILEPSQIWVRVYVPETRFGLVRVGQPAAISIDSFPGRTFPGRVAEINQRGEYTPRNIQTLDQRSDQVFGVKVLIDPQQELKPGMAALVTLK
jgi:multidrug resistance efflux pump